MRLVTKIYPFIHKTYTLCVLYVLRGEFLQWTHRYIASRRRRRSNPHIGQEIALLRSQ